MPHVLHNIVVKCLDFFILLEVLSDELCRGAVSLSLSPGKSSIRRMLLTTLIVTVFRYYYWQFADLFRLF